MSVEMAIPQTSEEMMEFLADNKKRSQIFKSDADPKTLTDFMSKYAQLSNKADPSIEAQMKAQIDKTLAEFAREHLVNIRRGVDNQPASRADIRAQKQTGAFYNKKAQGAPLNGKFENIVQFLDAISDKPDTANSELMAKRREVQNAMSSTDPGAGGFLIPEEFRSELLRVALETAIVRPRARVIPMASLRASIPFIDSTSNVSSVYGGVIAYWTEEGAALVQSQPAFGRIALEAKKLTAYTEVPNELRQDSAISVEAFINEAFPMAISWFEDLAFMGGTGVGEPLGVLNSLNSAMVTQAKESGQAASTIVWENILGMYARMLPASLNSAVWLVSPDAFPQLATMALTVGTGGAPVWLPNGNDSPYSTLLGRPVIITEKVNAISNSANVGTAGTIGSDVNFVDFSQYLVGDRMAMSAAASTEYRFGNDITAYRVIERVDGRPWMQSAITPRNGGNTLSPFVTLGAR